MVNKSRIKLSGRRATKNDCELSCLEQEIKNLE